MASPFYRYTDAAGRTHIVDRLDRVPADQRSSVERLDLRSAGAVIPTAAPAPRSVTATGMGDFVRALDAPSVVVGFGLAVTVYAVRTLVRPMAPMLLRLTLVATAVALFASGYLGWVRRASGVGDEALASPTQVLDDARKAARRMTDRFEAQRRVLRTIEEESQ